MNSIVLEYYEGASSRRGQNVHSRHVLRATSLCARVALNAASVPGSVEGRIECWCACSARSRRTCLTFLTL